MRSFAHVSWPAIASLIALAGVPRAFADGPASGAGPRPVADLAPPLPPAPDAEASRRATASTCASLFAKGGPASIAVERALDEGSVGVLPSRVESRAALAQSLATALSGVAVDPTAGAALASALAVAANTDGLSSTEIAEARGSIVTALDALRVSKESAESAVTAFDRIVGDTRCPLLRRVSADLRAIEGKDPVTAANARFLEDDLVELAAGGPKLSTATLHSLALDLSIALDDVWLGPKAHGRLVYGLQAVLGGGATTQDAFAAVVRDVKDVLVSAGVNRIEVELVLADLQTIHGETTGPQPVAPAKETR